jgi:hypothetical protein
MDKNIIKFLSTNIFFLIISPIIYTNKRMQPISIIIIY